MKIFGRDCGCAERRERLKAAAARLFQRRTRKVPCPVCRALKFYEDECRVCARRRA